MERVALTLNLPITPLELHVICRGPIRTIPENVTDGQDAGDQNELRVSSTYDVVTVKPRNKLCPNFIVL